MREFRELVCPHTSPSREAKGPEKQKISNTWGHSCRRAGSKASSISLRLKHLEHILREGTRRDRRCLSSELRAGVEVTREKALDPRIERGLGKTLTPEEVREGEMRTTEERLFPFKVKIRRWFNFVFHKPKVKNKKNPTRQGFLTHQNHHIGF